jgi:hypothetical protein
MFQTIGSFSFFLYEDLTRTQKCRDEDSIIKLEWRKYDFVQELPSEKYATALSLLNLEKAKARIEETGIC